VILEAANYYSIKGFEQLVDAFTQVAPRHPDAWLYLITRPPASLHEQIARSPLAARIRVLDPKPHAEILQWMA
jgi:glycosyltransferase involved in cell wall biosynthesis